MKLYIYLPIIIASVATPSFAKAKARAKPLPKTQIEFNRVKDTIKRCPAAAELLSKVKTKFAEKKLRVKMHLRPGAKWKRYSPAYCVPKHGRLYIRDDLSFNEKLHSAIFELANLSQAEAFNYIDEQLPYLHMTEERYVYKTEEVEYHSTKIHDKVIRACKRTSLWSRDVPEYRIKVDFPTHWVLEVKDSRHANEIRKSYKRLKSKI